MKSSIREEIINHNAKKLFDIVIDIEKYPNFIPWCSDMKVYSKSDKEIYADMKVLYSFLVPLTFSSHVVYDSKKLNIKTTYLEGPLKNLQTKWNFKPINNNETKINFVVKFEFKNYFHQKIAETFYNLIENKMIESFKRRANNILN